MRFSSCVALTLAAGAAQAYPTDEASYETSELRRLVWQRRVDAGERRGTKLPPGAQWPAERIVLRMLEDGSDYQLTVDTPKDPELQAGLEEILKRNRWKYYNVALLDITNPAKPRYAGVNETLPQTPGSVAKLLVGAGLLQQLKERYPDDVEKRAELLRTTMVPADHWPLPTHHEVPKVTADTFELTSISRVRAGDLFSLWEWMDHALSPSSNAAATMTWREATLMAFLGDEYPPEKWDEELYRRWDRDQWTEKAFAVVDKPLNDAGLGTDGFYLRMFFTRNANKYIRSQTSRATPLSLLQWTVKMEQGKMIDRWSSLELKKMIYITRRRVRYLYGTALNECGAYFKSGSLYMCRPEKGFRCGKYMGNKVNALNSLVMIETAPPVERPRVEIPDFADAVSEPAPRTSETTADRDDHPRQHVYVIAVMSNELKRNAAFDHALLGREIHTLVTGQEKCEPPLDPQKMPEIVEETVDEKVLEAADVKVGKSGAETP